MKIKKKRKKQLLKSVKNILLRIIVQDGPAVEESFVLEQFGCTIAEFEFLKKNSQELSDFLDQAAAALYEKDLRMVKRMIKDRSTNAQMATLYMKLRWPEKLAAADKGKKTAQKSQKRPKLTIELSE